MSFEAIYRRYHQDLYRYCLAILGNREDAQDALQNTMIKAMRALQGEKRQIKLKPWLYRIAHNESVDMLRRHRPTEEINVDLAAGPGAAEAAETRERLRRLIADLDELPDRQRGALVMRELSGLSFEQIGAAFATSGAVARQTVYEARLSLREMEEGREMSCEHVMHTLSNADGRIVRRRAIRSHLRACPSCRRFRDDIAARRHELASLAPLPAVAAAGLLQGILGAASSGGSGAGLAGSVGAGAGKAVATSAIAKSAATVAVVATVGAGAADRGGLVDVPLLPSSKSETRQVVQPAPATEPSSTEARLAPAVKRAGKEIRQLRRQGKTGESPKPLSASRQTDALAATPASIRGAMSGHGPPDGLPARSSHGQQTAATHRSDHGNRSKGQSQSKTQDKKPKGQSKKPPAPQSKSKAPGDPRPDRSPPVIVEPDKRPTTPLYPSNATNQGAP